MEKTCRPDTIFATNTSAIPIREIAAQAQRPQNVIGMHYFSPVPQMPLLEIIPHETTSDEVIATAYTVGAAQGKTCIVVKDVPGFYVNRCLGPYMVEVSALLKDGVSLEQLDAAILKFGMPVGPITLADEVGIDVSAHVGTFLSKADLGVRMAGGDASLMQYMVDKGFLGKKSGAGFYQYGKSGKKESKKTVNPAVATFLQSFVKKDLKLTDGDITDRIVGRFVNEAAKCLEDEIIENPVVGDIGLVFGTGFAPFRGGPFRYLDQMGVQVYVDKMHKLAAQYDAPQFEPCQLLKDYAKAGKTFHGKK
jgi:enoyl-CoA hydratase / long-chain 3-hydroxyacyl-CoA dehydrogenase